MKSSSWPGGCGAAGAAGRRSARSRGPSLGASAAAPRSCRPSRGSRCPARAARRSRTGSRRRRPGPDPTASGPSRSSTPITWNGHVLDADGRADRILRRRRRAWSTTVCAEHGDLGGRVVSCARRRSSPAATGQSRTRRSSAAARPGRRSTSWCRRRLHLGDCRDGGSVTPCRPCTGARSPRVGDRERRGAAPARARARRWSRRPE